MAASLASRTAVITGASAGIGRSLAERLLARGARVVGIARDFSKREPLPAARFEAVSLDLADLDALEEALPALARRLAAADAVVAAAGAGRFGSLEEQSAGQVRALVDLNLTSQILLARAFLPGLKRHGRADLVFLGSEAALTAGRRGAVYTATKHAVRGLAHALREECAKSGVRVSVIHPGMVRTGFFDGLAFAPGEDDANALRPEDVAEAIVHVLSAHPGTVFDEISLSPLKKVVRFRKDGGDPEPGA